MPPPRRMRRVGYRLAGRFRTHARHVSESRVSGAVRSAAPVTRPLSQDERQGRDCHVAGCRSRQRYAPARESGTVPSQPANMRLGRQPAAPAAGRPGSVALPGDPAGGQVEPLANTGGPSEHGAALATARILAPLQTIRVVIARCRFRPQELLPGSAAVSSRPATSKRRAAWRQKPGDRTRRCWRGRDPLATPSARSRSAETSALVARRPPEIGRTCRRSG